MPDNICGNSYRAECQSITSEAVRELIEENNGPYSSLRDDAYERIRETVDGHQWVIYYRYNDAVLRYSDNEDAWEECYSAEDMGRLVMDKGMDGACTVQACFAMMQDCMELLDDEIDNQTEAWEEAHPEVDA